MGDVAQILGLGSKAPPDAGALPLGGSGSQGSRKRDRKAVKPAGMSREVFALLGADGLPPLVPASDAKAGAAFKRRRVTGQEGKWLKTTFRNSAREDGYSPRHWQKASVEYPDYPFSRFNVHLEHVVYTEEEYERVLRTSSWTRSETDYLMILCQRWDLRWPVISDRYALTPRRPVEELQKRYYDVIRALVLSRSNASKANIPGPQVAAAAAVAATTSAAESAAAASANGGAGPGSVHKAAIAGIGAGVGAGDPRSASAARVKPEDGAGAAPRQVAGIGAQRPGKKVGGDKKPTGAGGIGLGRLDAGITRKADGRKVDGDGGPGGGAKATRPQVSPEDVGLTLLGTGGSLDTFNAEFERERREQLDVLFKRSRTQEAEEAQLRAEYKALESQLKKLKKSAATVASLSTMNALGPGLGHKQQNAAKQSLLDCRRMLSRAAPQSGEPYLMSSRLMEVGQTANGTAPATLSTGIVKKMHLVLEEFQISKDLFRMPTKLVCDLYDAVREEIIVMLTLKKLASRKETELHNFSQTLKRLNNTSKASARKSGSHSSASSKAKLAKAKKAAGQPMASTVKGGGVAGDSKPPSGSGRAPNVAPAKGRVAKPKAAGAAGNHAGAASNVAAMKKAIAKAGTNATGIAAAPGALAPKAAKARAPQKRKVPAGAAASGPAKKRKPVATSPGADLAAALKAQAQAQAQAQQQQLLLQQQQRQQQAAAAAAAAAAAQAAAVSQSSPQGTAQVAGLPRVVGKK